MANDAPKKVGGEVGDVRANIDQDKLNEYLREHVPAVKAPVSIKQFKVNASDPSESTSSLAFSLVRYAPTQPVRPKCRLITNTVQPDLFLDRCQVRTRSPSTLFPD
jgi:hypothetical protein